MECQTKEGVLFLSGRLFIDTVDAMADVLLKTISEAEESVQIDLSGVTDVDTVTLQAFLSSKRLLEQKGMRLQLLLPNKTVQKRFQLLGLGFLCET